MVFYESDLPSLTLKLLIYFRKFVKENEKVFHIIHKQHIVLDFYLVDQNPNANVSDNIKMCLNYLIKFCEN